MINSELRNVERQCIGERTVFKRDDASFEQSVCKNGISTHGIHIHTPKVSQSKIKNIAKKKKKEKKNL